MEQIKEMLFQQQRFSILALFTSSSATRNVPSSYAYAWSEGIYPFLDEGADFHKPYADQFEIGEEELDALHKRLCDAWDQKTPINFYMLESESGGRYGSTWDRSKLLRACRYLHLHKHFDKDFWDMFLKNGDCPVEAFSIRDAFKPENVYFA